jgi:hypothetical protein
MSHVKITAECTGDPITAISAMVGVAKNYGEDIRLLFKEGFFIMVRPTSDTQDLFLIYRLELKSIQ